MMTRCDSRSGSGSSMTRRRSRRSPIPCASPRWPRCARPTRRPGWPAPIGHSRQLVNYHLKELERAGLIVPAGERRKGNFVEQLFRADGEHVRRVAPVRVGRRRPRAAFSAIRLHSSTSSCSANGSQRRRDRCCSTAPRSTATRLRAPPSTARSGSPTKPTRSAFMTEYLAMLGPLLKKYGAKQGLRYRVVVAVPIQITRRTHERHRRVRDHVQHLRVTRCRLEATRPARRGGALAVAGVRRARRRDRGRAGHPAARAQGHGAVRWERDRDRARARGDRHEGHGLAVGVPRLVRRLPPMRSRSVGVTSSPISRSISTAECEANGTPVRGRRSVARSARRSRASKSSA